MNEYCNNCGNYGHSYKNCRHPIMSYGILLFHKDEKNIHRVVMVERKDSISYIEFIRGKYKNATNYKYIKLLLSRMTNIEKERLLKYDFDKLWNKLWIYPDKVNYRIQKEYKKSKTIFNQLKNGNKNENLIFSLQSIIDELDSNQYLNNEWEIPKGRRKLFENNKNCAIREFLEETNIKEEDYTIINNIIPFIEEYKGINNVRYKHVYYIAKMNSNQLINLKINQNNKEQLTEIKDISWLNEEECYQKIRDHDISKQKIISDFFNFLKNDLQTLSLVG